MLMTEWHGGHGRHGRHEWHEWHWQHGQHGYLVRHGLHVQGWEVLQAWQAGSWHEWHNWHGCMGCMGGMGGMMQWMAYSACMGMRVCAIFCLQEVGYLFVSFSSLWSVRLLFIVVAVLIEFHFAGSPLSLERGLRHVGPFIANRVFCPVFGYIFCMSEHAGMRFYLDMSVVCLAII
jgi:hypothetical protein